MPKLLRPSWIDSKGWTSADLPLVYLFSVDEMGNKMLVLHALSFEWTLFWALCLHVSRATNSGQPRAQTRARLKSKIFCFFSESGILLRKIRVVPIEQLCEVCHVLNLKCILICQLPCVFFRGVLHCYIQTNLLINQLSDNRRKAEKSKNELGLKLI